MLWSVLIALYFLNHFGAVAEDAFGAICRVLQPESVKRQLFDRIAPSNERTVVHVTGAGRCVDMTAKFVAQVAANASQRQPGFERVSERMPRFLRMIDANLGHVGH